MLAKQNPELGVSMHLIITTEMPVLRTHQTMADQKGQFIKVNKALKEDSRIDLTEIKNEWIARIQKVYVSGIKPTRIDSYHHIHGEEKLLPIATEIANYYGLPMRMVEVEHREKVDVHQYGVETLFVDFFDQIITHY